jgi:hypothetical protein
LEDRSWYIWARIQSKEKRWVTNSFLLFFLVSNKIKIFLRSDPREYALKQIEGTGLSTSACREIAVYYLIKYFSLINVLI